MYNYIKEQNNTKYHVFIFKVNDNKNAEDIYRQTNLAIKRIKQRHNKLNSVNKNNIFANLGTVNDDFVNKKMTLQIVFLYEKV